MSSPVISACKKVAEMSKVDILHPKAMDKANRSFKVVKKEYWQKYHRCLL